MSETDDVFDLINSLPETASTQDSSKTNSKPTDDKEVFDFLDEIAQHEQKKPKKKLEPKKKQVENVVSSNDDDEEVEETNDPTTGTSSSDTTDDHTQHQKDEEKEAASTQSHDTSEVNPIASLSSWWSSEGNQKVSSLWGTITSNAEKLSEQTYQLASTTTNQLNERSKQLDTEQIGSRLNNLFINISQQIKQGLVEDADEVLNILLVSDLYNFTYLHKLVSNNFNLAMNQVEGDVNVNVHEFNHHDENSGGDEVTLNLFYGKLIDGEKLANANLENAIKEYKKAEIAKEKKDGEDEKQREIKREATDNRNDTFQEIIKSNIFITIQPITTKLDSKPQDTDPTNSASPTISSATTTTIDSHNVTSFSFTLILKDITNNITITTRTQPFPLRWAQWLDGEPLKLNDAGDVELDLDSVDPKEWVKDWIRQGLNLGVGVLAQEYVIKRMGI
ncbi:hypothetical protein KGF57_000821 [Candida theae]|uniref:Maintenance of telomere capping protein 1 n=1 Tax=Candida theae TaxID=1198502 RepID=A0AAD5BI18_9ASCO|nr:uncharacterized protein KGF57_000821 [Candida theae]KAI5965028.1 hypothetical protein KGF57_000821 [Candida theae]